MKRFVLLILAVGLVLSSACTKKETPPQTATPSDDKGKLKVGLVLDKGGRDDKSFNAAAFKGSQEAQTKLGVEVKVVEASDDTAIEPSLRTFAQKGYPLVIGIGFVQSAAVQKVASAFPNTHFLIVDSEVNLPNVRSVLFAEHEGSYLVGYIAGLTSKSHKVGFVGGMDIPLIRRFELGYRSGTQAAFPKTEVLSNYVGATSDAWKNPTKAKELALSQYKKDVDVIFAAAGASGLGVFDAAEELKKFVIGVDSNQNWVKPGRVLTSMIKRVDLAVFRTIEDEQQKRFAAGNLRWGIQEGGVDFAVDEHNRAIVTPEIESKINEVKARILKGDIKVPDYYETSKPAAPAESKTSS